MQNRAEQRCKQTRTIPYIEQTRTITYTEQTRMTTDTEQTRTIPYTEQTRTTADRIRALYPERQQPVDFFIFFEYFIKTLDKYFQKLYYIYRW